MGTNCEMDPAKIILVALDDGAILPTRANPTDAGLDLYTPKSFTVPARGSAEVDTGVRVQLPHGTCGLIRSKSGLMRKGIVTDGTIDEGYTNSIKVVVFNMSDSAYTFERGKKVTQLVVAPCLYLEPVEVYKITGGPRGDAGFGSTGE